MDSRELIKEWPQWRTAGAVAVIASPAFAVPVEFGGEHLLLRSGEPLSGETLDIDLRFEDLPCRLSLADSPHFPDLHALWSRKRDLPRNLLLALVEKECGDLFQALENAARMQLAITGLSPDGTVAATRQRCLQLGDVHLAMELPMQVSMVFGSVEHLDTSHECIRSLTRDIWVEYIRIPLAPEAAASLAVGDVLLLPDDFPAQAVWTTEPPAGDMLRLRNPEAAVISFGEMADGTLPPIPEAQTLTLYRQNKAVADGELSTIGEMKCFRLTHLR